MADLINATDSLNTGRVKINAIIEDASAAVIAAESASATAGEAKTTANSVQTQLDTIILVDGASDAEVVQSRVDKDGKLYATLKGRLDSSDAQLAQIVVNVKDFGAIGDGITDDSQAIQNALDLGNKILLPSGTYYVPTPLIYNKDNLKIEGDNATLISDSVIFTAPSTADFGIELLKNISIKGITFKPITTGFVEQKVLLIISGVDGFIVENCSFLEWNGDAIQTDTTYGAGRLPLSPKNITIKQCRFEGIYGGNRNSITIFRAENMYIENNYFKNSGSHGMPGCICVEPWMYFDGEQMVNNVYVTNNIFEKIVGGSGCFHAFIDHPTHKLGNFHISKNTFVDIESQFVSVIQEINQTQELTHFEPTSVTVTENTFNGSENVAWRFLTFSGVNGLIIKDNHFNNVKGQAWIGETLDYALKKCVNVTIKNNEFYNPRAQDLLENSAYFQIGAIENLRFIENTFIIINDTQSDFNQQLIRVSRKTDGYMKNMLIKDNIAYHHGRVRFYCFVMSPIGTDITVGENLLGAELVNLQY